MIDTMIASIHANNGSIIITLMPISTKPRQPNQDSLASFFSFSAFLMPL